MLIGGESAPQMPTFHREGGGVPLIWAMPEFKLFFMCVLPKHHCSMSVCLLGDHFRTFDVTYIDISLGKCDELLL